MRRRSLLFFMALVTGCSAAVGERDNRPSEQALSNIPDPGKGPVVTSPAAPSWLRVMLMSASDPQQMQLYTTKDGYPWMQSTAGDAQAGLGLAVDPEDETSPASVSWDGAKRADVFYVGANRRMRHVFSDDRGSTWHMTDWDAPTALNFLYLYGTPGALSTEPGNVEVYALYKAFGGTPWIYARRYNVGGIVKKLGDWTYVADAPAYAPQWRDAGVAAIASPYLTADGTEAIRRDLFVASGMQELTHYSSVDGGSSWASEPFPTAAPMIGTVQVGYAQQWGYHRLFVFYHGYDALVHVLTYDSDVPGFVSDEGIAPPCPASWQVGLRGVHGAAVSFACEITDEGSNKSDKKVYEYDVLAPDAGWLPYTVDEPVYYWKANPGSMIYFSR